MLTLLLALLLGATAAQSWGQSHCANLSSVFHLHAEFFNCGQVIPRMWLFVNTLIDRLQLPHKLYAISGLHTFIHNTDCSTPSLQCIMNQNLVINALKAVWNAYQSKHEQSHTDYEKEVINRFNMLLHIEFRMYRLHSIASMKISMGSIAKGM